MYIQINGRHLGINQVQNFLKHAKQIPKNPKEAKRQPLSYEKMRMMTGKTKKIKKTVYNIIYLCNFYNARNIKISSNRCQTSSHQVAFVSFHSKQKKNIVILIFM
jgi:hypothetical protein